MISINYRNPCARKNECEVAEKKKGAVGKVVLKMKNKKGKFSCIVAQGTNGGPFQVSFALG